jgi:hypothetical protein
MATKGLDVLNLVLSKSTYEEFFSVQKKVIFPLRGG